MPWRILPVVLFKERRGAFASGLRPRRKTGSRLPVQGDCSQSFFRYFRAIMVLYGIILKNMGYDNEIKGIYENSRIFI
jgi:hypothetical protein